MIIPRYIIGFSGHRHLAEAHNIRSAIHASLSALKAHALAQGAQVELYSSAAYGADLLALDCATKLQIPIHLSLPLPEDEFVQDFVDHDEDWSQAHSFISVARNGANGGTFRVQRDHHRSECYYAEATKLVDACDFLLTVWDGEKAQGLGGTAQVIDLAIAHQKPVLRISTVDPKPISPAEITAAWPAPDEKITAINYYLQQHKPVEGDVRRPAPRTATPPAPNQGLVTSPTTAEELQSALDKIADVSAPTFRRGMARSIKLHSLAALLGAIPSLFYFAFISDPAHPAAAETARWNQVAQIFTAVEFLCVIIALGISLRIKWGKVQFKWQQTRLATELVRGLRASRPWLDPLHPLAARHLPQWRRFALTTNLMAAADALSGQPLAAQKETYRTQRIEDQRQHFAKNAATAIRSHRRWTRIAKWSAITAPIFVLLAFIDKAQGGQLTQTWPGALCGKFLPVALPLLAGVATAHRTTLDLTRRAHRYPEMIRRLQSKATALTPLETTATCASVVTQTEELLLDELIEWNHAAKSVGAH